MVCQKNILIFSSPFRRRSLKKMGMVQKRKMKELFGEILLNPNDALEREAGV